jgi:hypothetical protein
VAEGIVLTKGVTRARLLRLMRVVVQVPNLMKKEKSRA